MKIKKLANGLELRHSDDGFTLSFIPANGKGGALVNMSQMANERGYITGGIMFSVMGEVMEEECIITQNKREETIESLKNIQRENEKMQIIHSSGSPTWHNHESIDDLIFNLLTKLGD